jgi:hypothetical protein
MPELSPGVRSSENCFNVDAMLVAAIALAAYPWWISISNKGKHHLRRNTRDIGDNQEISEKRL